MLNRLIMAGAESLLNTSEQSPSSTQMVKSESSQGLNVVQTTPNVTNSILEDLLKGKHSNVQEAVVHWSCAGDIQVEDVPSEHQAALLNYLGTKIQQEALYT